MAGIDGVHEVVLYLLRNQFGGVLHLLDKELYVLLDAAILILDDGALLVHESFQGFHLVGGQGHDHFGLEGDGVAHVAAVP